MNEPTQLVDHLAHIVRDYPRGGGHRPDGMIILQNSNGKALPEDVKARKYWPKDSTVPDQVAQILLGIQFHNQKATASCFDAAKAVTQHFGWKLSWKDDFQLGAYLISCLLKAEYYRMFNILQSNYRIEYALQCRRKEVLEYPENDSYTSNAPFAPWISAIDEQGRQLVTPSFPQLKRTVWEPSDDEFTVGKPPPGVMEGFRLEHSFTKDDIDVWKTDSVAMRGVGIHVWVRAVNKLETNRYQINQKLLSAVNEIVGDKRKAPKEKSPTLESEREALEREHKLRKRGGIWKEFSPEERYMSTLDNLWVLQKQQDKKREKKDPPQKPLKDDDKRRYLRKDQNDVRKEYWSRWYDNAEAREIWRTKFNDFHRTLKRAIDLGDAPFYQRAFLDYRGRVYLNKSRVNYQGGDLPRGLIDFADGKKVRKSDMTYLWIHLANTFGEKGTAKQLETAAKRNKAKFLKWGRNPVKWYSEWSKESDDKWQFIRGCIELAELTKNPNHKSTLIVEADQSTSCLQHIALVLTDQELACRVNLCKNYNDIYQEIADGIQELSKLKQETRRKIIKMALVPWTYGGNAWTACQEYHQSDLKFLKDMGSSGRLSFAHRMISEIERSLHTAHQYTEDWQALVDQRFDNTTYRNAIWETPSEFTVHCYKQMTNEERAYLWRREKLDDEHRAPTYKLTAYEPDDEVDDDKIKTSFPPNYVHSIDASVMHFVLAYTPENQPVVGVHDALGSLIRDAKDVRQRFRTAIHRIYAHQHPYRTIIEGVPQEIAWVEEEEASKFVATIRHAPHLIN